MNVSKRTPSRVRLFYGWYILASCFAILFFNSGARYSFGVAFIEDRKSNATGVSAILTCVCDIFVVLASTSPFGKLIVSHKSSAGHREAGYNWFN
jgi:hypothetical protein